MVTGRLSEQVDESRFAATGIKVPHSRRYEGPVPPGRDSTPARWRVTCTR
jgi:hypothetical protein